MANFKTLSVFNSKGGVGKSTIIASLGYELGKYGKTLIIDADPQGSLSKLFLEKELEKEENQYNDLFHLFNAETTTEKSIYKVRNEDDNGYKGLYVIPAGDNRKFRAYISSQYQNCPEKSFKEILDEIKELEFNYVLVDLPGSINYYEGSILSRLDEIIPITQPETFSTDSFKVVLTDIKKFNHTLNGNCKFSKYIIINSYVNDNKVHQHYTELLEKTYPMFVQVIVNYTKIASSANSQHLVLQEWAQNNKSSKMIQLLASKIKIGD